MGTLKTIAYNPRNAVVQLGHYNGVCVCVCVCVRVCACLFTCCDSLSCRNSDHVDSQHACSSGEDAVPSWTGDGAGCRPWGILPGHGCNRLLCEDLGHPHISSVAHVPVPAAGCLSGYQPAGIARHGKGEGGGGVAGCADEEAEDPLPQA